MLRNDVLHDALRYDDDMMMMMIRYAFIPYKMRIVAASKKIGCWCRPVFWRRSGAAGGALLVHTDAVFAAVFGAVYRAYSCSFVKS